MFKRKIEDYIENYLLTDNESILVVDGARQVGKTTTITKVGSKLFDNFISINFVEDKEGGKLFADVNSLEEFDLILSSYSKAKDKLNNGKPILIFLDEIQEYPQYLTLLKFFKQQKKYKFICSGSLLGVALQRTTSIPVGSMRTKRMFPMDFEEFLWANGISEESTKSIKEYFRKLKSLPQGVHNVYMNWFKKYLLIGGLPEAVKIFTETSNIQLVRSKHNEIIEQYIDDASKYDIEHKLKIKNVYKLIPSSLENIKKRLIFRDIEKDKRAIFETYLDEFDYLAESGIAIDVKSISNPCFPLIKSTRKNLIKFYLNDVGLLSNLYFNISVKPVLDCKNSVNMGSLYECAVANELKAHGYSLYYYDNKQKGEVDFIVDDFISLSPLPIEVKSGKNYYVHSALNNLLKIKEYEVKKAYVFSNIDKIVKKDSIVYLPIYFVMCIDINNINPKDTIIK